MWSISVPKVLMMMKIKMIEDVQLMGSFVYFTEAVNDHIFLSVVMS